MAEAAQAGPITFAGDYQQKVKALTTLWRRDYATVRQLEGTMYRVLGPLAAVMLVGVALVFTTILLAAGVLLCAISAALMVVFFVWAIRLQKRPRRDIRCPYCTNKNTVFEAVPEFECDICHRPIVFNELGAPVPSDGSLDDAKPVSIYGQQPD